MTTDRKVTSLSEKEKAEALKTVDAAMAKLDRQYGAAIVRWATNRRNEATVERAKLKKEKAQLERRLAEIG